MTSSAAACYRVRMPRVLYIGLEPSLVDFTSMPDLTADKLNEGIRSEIAKLEANGIDARWLALDKGQTALQTLGAELERTTYDCIVVGAGLRVIPDHFLLFEKIVNLLHSKAPTATIAFNTKPTDTLDAVKRWVA